MAIGRKTPDYALKKSRNDGSKTQWLVVTIVRAAIITFYSRGDMIDDLAQNECLSTISVLSLGTVSSVSVTHRAAGRVATY